MVAQAGQSPSGARGRVAGVCAVRCSVVVSFANPLEPYHRHGDRQAYRNGEYWASATTKRGVAESPQITAYVLQPDGSFSDKAGERQLAQAIAYLTAENKSSVRKVRPL